MGCLLLGEDRFGAVLLDEDKLWAIFYLMGVDLGAVLFVEGRFRGSFTC